MCQCRKCNYKGMIIHTPEDFAVMRLLLKGKTTREISHILHSDISRICNLTTKYTKQFGDRIFVKRKVDLGYRKMAVRMLTDEGKYVIRRILCGEKIPDGRAIRAKKKGGTSCTALPH